MLLLAAAETIQGAFGVSDLIFLYRRPMAVLRITLATILVNLAAGALLIVPLGIDGAALATLVAFATGAIVRRHLLRSRFGLRIPLHYSAGPAIAAALALLAAAATTYFLTSAPALVVTGISLVSALLAYAAVLKLWLVLAGKSLALVKFQTDSTSNPTIAADLTHQAWDQRAASFNRARTPGCDEPAGAGDQRVMKGCAATSRHRQPGLWWALKQAG